MSEKLIIFILLVVYLARPKQSDEIQISGEMKSGCFYIPVWPRINVNNFDGDTDELRSKSFITSPADV